MGQTQRSRCSFSLVIREKPVVQDSHSRFVILLVQFNILKALIYCIVIQRKQYLLIGSIDIYIYAVCDKDFYTRWIQTILSVFMR